MSKLPSLLLSLCLFAGISWSLIPGVSAALHEPPGEGDGSDDDTATPAQADNRESFQTLRGFLHVLKQQLSRTLREDRLLVANGNPIEPGVYFTVNNKGIYAFDQPLVTIQDGKIPSTWEASPRCQSACPAAMYEEMRRLWLQWDQEAVETALNLPTRALFAFDRDVSSLLAIYLAYSVSEARPGLPPSLHLIVNSGRGGIRARPFYLLPPQGLQIASGDKPLGLRIEVGAGQKYWVSALDARLGSPFEVQGADRLRAQLKEIKKKFPGKNAMIVAPKDNVPLSELFVPVEAAQGYFSKTVFALPAVASSAAETGR